MTAGSNFLGTEDRISDMMGCVRRIACRCPRSPENQEKAPYDYLNFPPLFYKHGRIDKKWQASKKARPPLAPHAIILSMHLLYLGLSSQTALPSAAVKAYPGDILFFPKLHKNPPFPACTCSLNLLELTCI